MIEPSPAQRGVIGEQHGLVRLTTTLEALTQGQHAQQTATEQLQAQCARQTATLARLAPGVEDLMQGQRTQMSTAEQLQQQLAHQTAALARMVPTLRWQGMALVLLAVLTVASLGLAGWQALHPQDLTYARGLGAVDGVLAQQWGSLPKGTQEALAAAYGRVGLVPPGERK